MAEFASAVLGLAAAGAKVGNSLYALIDTIKDAPNEFLVLSNEVTDFREILTRLMEAKDSGDFTWEEKRRVSWLGQLIARGDEIVQDIESLVQRVSRQKQGNSEVNRIKWLRQVRKAKKLQESLRVLKSTICDFLTLVMLKASARNGVQVAGLQIQMASISENQLTLLEKQETISSKFTVSQRMLEQASGPPLDSRIEEGSNVAIASRRSIRGKASLARLHSDNSQVRGHRFRASFKVSGPRPLRCLDDCPCRCHYRAIIRSPRYLSDSLGDFFLGCSSLPWCFSGFMQCNEQSCRRSRVATTELRYFFPPWFSYAVASFSVSFNFRMLPLNVCLQTRHTIPYDSPILVCVQEGDIEGTRMLLRSGTASLNDVDPYGLGLLYYAAYYCWRGSGRKAAIEVSQFLLDMGAHADWEDEIGNTPMETIVDDTLVSLAMQYSTARHDLSDFQHIAQLFGKCTFDLLEDFVEERDFTTLHQVLLGIRYDLGTLDEYLNSIGSAQLPPQFIDVPDSCGRTPLAWAVEYGWADATRTLLRYGSDPHQLRPSVHGKSPLLHLVIAGPVSTDAGFLDVVKALLEAGSDVNAVDHEGWTPLHELAEFGADALNWDLLTNDKQSAVELSIGGGFSADVQHLLQTHTLAEESTNDNEVNDESSSSGLSSDEEDLDEEFFDAVEFL
ncbi:MAG: hypothetical protein M1829_000667 [Trizodia sp. TS-e1964]|nr:MAG: hypothetical protein M1829_000667 [Trizodia sp. TS-e1964]